jgi:hypothetical protein
MTERELNHFTNLCHLLSASTDIVVSNVVHLFLVLTLDGITFTVNDRIGSDNTVGSWIRFYDLEFHRVHGRADQKEITLLDGTVGFEEVGLEVDVKEVSRHAFNGIIERKNVNALAVGDVTAAGDGNNVSKTNAKVLPNDLVHADVCVVTGFVSQDNADSVLTLFALNQDSVSAEKFQLLHLGRGQANHGVVIVGGVIDNKPVRTALLTAQDGIFHVFVVVLAARHKRERESE